MLLVVLQYCHGYALFRSPHCYPCSCKALAFALCTPRDALFPLLLAPTFFASASAFLLAFFSLPAAAAAAFSAAAAAFAAALAFLASFSASLAACRHHHNAHTSTQSVQAVLRCRIANLGHTKIQSGSSGCSAEPQHQAPS
jgi:hypothetical protein